MEVRILDITTTTHRTEPKYIENPFPNEKSVKKVRVFNDEEKRRFEEALGYGANISELCYLLNTYPGSLKARIVYTYWNSEIVNRENLNLSTITLKSFDAKDIIEHFRNAYTLAIKKRQFERMQDGDTQLLIHLGKSELGQATTKETETPVVISDTIVRSLLELATDNIKEEKEMSE